MGRRFLSIAYYESQSEPATSSPRAQPPPAALSSSPPPSPPAPTRRAPRRVSSTARTLDPELAAIRAETSAALESVSNRLQNLRALLIAASSLNMNAQPGSSSQPDDDNGGDRGPDVGPGHSAIVITPGSDAAVQTSQSPPPSSVTFSQGADDPRTSLARRLQEGPPSPSQQPVAQRLVEAVREIRATIDRAPGLAERLGRIAAATAPETTPASTSTGASSASTLVERRRSVAAPILVEFQQRRAAWESRVARASASANTLPTDVGTAPSDPPALVPATMRRVRYNADGEEIPVQTMQRALDGRPLFHVMGGRPRPIPRRASAETVIVPESPRDSDGEGDILAMESPYWTPPSPIRRNQVSARMFPPADSSGTAQGSSSRRSAQNAGSLTFNRWRDALILNESPADFLAPEDSPTRDISRHRSFRLDVESTPPAITPAAGITDSAWRTRMEFLTSTVNLPLGDNANNETTRSTSPVRQEVLKAAVVPREEPPALIPCPLPQPIEDLMASDDEDGNGSLQPGVLYW